MTCGVYVITDTTTGHEYVGSSKDMEKRWYLHRYRLQVGKHHSRRLQEAWNAAGPFAFRFDILAECDPTERQVLEDSYIHERKPELNGTLHGTSGSRDGLSGRPRIKAGEETIRFTVRLTAEQEAKAVRLGKGNFSEGVRVAIEQQMARERAAQEVRAALDVAWHAVQEEEER